MITRTRRETVTFERSFSLKDLGRNLPAGVYEIMTDEELIEGVSFPAYRRVSTMMLVPAAPPGVPSRGARALPLRKPVQGGAGRRGSIRWPAVARRG